MREWLKTTERIGFSVWTDADADLAMSLWGDAEVSRYICAAGSFSEAEVQARLQLEISNYEKWKIQYFPIFEKETGTFIGCCGLRPFEGQTDVLEIGFHLKKEFWGRGLAFEAAKAMMAYARDVLEVKELRAGHHPRNEASRNLLERLGFLYTGDLFYAPTGLQHPSYTLPLRV